MRPIAAGVVGVGRLGAAHSRLLDRSPAFQLVGVHDRNGGRAEAVAGSLAVPAFAEVGELYARAEAVVIAVPTAAHHAQAVAAIRAGCHALIEKPLASSLGEADDIVRLAEARGLVLGVGHVERFNGLLRAAEPYVDRPRFIESLRTAPFQPRGADVNVVLDLMIHDIDLVLALTSAPLREVRAAGVSVISSSIDLANARLSLADGTVANLTASRVASRKVRRLRLFQRSGYFSLDLAAERGRHDRRRDPPRAGAGGVEDLLERIDLQGVPGEPLARELDAFASAIAGRPHRLVSGREGREALEVATRITREIEEFVHVVAQDP